jgi:hypothetical protein
VASFEAWLANLVEPLYDGLQTGKIIGDDVLDEVLEGLEADEQAIHELARSEAVRPLQVERAERRERRRGLFFRRHRPGWFLMLRAWFRR